MSFPARNKGGGDNPQGEKLAIGLLFSSNAVFNTGEIAPVRLNVERFNTGIAYNSTTGEITVPEDGTILINASLGALTQATPFSITALVYKNGLPLRQHASSSGEAPYVSAEVTVIDQCVAGDEYILYVTDAGNDGQNYTLQAGNGVTGLELAYL